MLEISPPVSCAVRKNFPPTTVVKSKLSYIFIVQLNNIPVKVGARGRRVFGPRCVRPFSKSGVGDKIGSDLVVKVYHN